MNVPETKVEQIIVKKGDAKCTRQIIFFNTIREFITHIS